MATIRDRLDAAQAVMQTPRGGSQPSPIDNLDTIRKHLERLNDTLGELPELIRVMSRKLDNPIRLSVRASQQKPIIGTTGWNNRLYVPNAAEVVAVGAYVPGPALDAPIRLRFNGSTLDETPQFTRSIAGPVAQPQYLELTAQPLIGGAPAVVVVQFYTSWQGGWLLDSIVVSQGYSGASAVASSSALAPAAGAVIVATGILAAGTYELLVNYGLQGGGAAADVDNFQLLHGATVVERLGYPGGASIPASIRIPRQINNGETFSLQAVGAASAGTTYYGAIVATPVV